MFSVLTFILAFVPRRLTTSLKGLKVVIFFGSKRFVTTANTLNVVIDLHVDLNVVGDGARGKS